MSVVFRVFVFLSLAFSLGAMGGSAFAQEDNPLPIIEWQKRLAADERMTAYGNDLLGDRIDRHMGTLSFEHIDVSFPGNSDLEVAIRRRLTQGENYQETVAVEFADWEIGIPKISAIVTDEYGWDGDRCSDNWGGNFPSFYEGTNQFTARDYTNGVTMDIPGHGSQPVLKTISDTGTPGDAYTTQNWYFTCTAASDSGEGFIAHAPNGTKYYFTKFISRAYNRLGFAKHTGPVVHRNKVILAATEVRDVHDNWVRYKYTSDRLTKIYSNDDREITLSYDGNLISKVTANNREWEYVYRDTTYEKPYWHPQYLTGTNLNRKILSEVKRPDNLKWSFTTDAMQAEPSPTSRYCPRYEHTVSITHPNGTTGTFVLKDIEHRQSDKFFTAVGFYCRYENGPSNPPILPSQAPPYQLRTTRAFAVLSKTLSASNIPSATWTFEYEREDPCTGLWPNMCSNYNPYQTYTGGATLPHAPPSPAYDYWWSNVQSPTTYYSDQAYPGHDPLDFTNWTKVTAPDETKTIHYHHWNSEELFGGKEIRRTIKDSGGTILQEMDFTYAQRNCYGGNGTFPGANRKSTACPTHTTKTVTSRDGDVFTTETDYNIDRSEPDYSYGFPVESRTFSDVTGSTTPRVRTTEYQHNTNTWILGLPTRVALNDRELATFQYDNLDKGLKMSQSRYGQADFLTFEYHANGTMRHYEDALDRGTEAHDWHRGHPQTIIQAVGTLDKITTQSTVDDNGWVTSQTDAKQNTTLYDHDIMGRLTQVNPPGSWDNTNIAYSFPSSGGAIQTITKGQSESTITYDSMFRPTLEQTNALDTGWTSYVNTKYDALGRVIFTSQPSSSEFETKGVDTTYDGLGRVTYVTENVAPFAQTRHRYLSNHRYQVTDPSGASTRYYSYGYGGPGNKDYRLIQKRDSSGTTLQNTWLQQNEFGQMTGLRQWGNHDGKSVDKTQSFRYDSNQRLCNHYVSEHGGTVYRYDAAGQMTGYTKGLSSQTCNFNDNRNARVSQTYDNLGRPIFTDFKDDDTPDITKSYDDNGNVETIFRGSGAEAVNWTYIYNELNMLTDESLTLDGRSFNTAYAYTSSGYLRRQTQPSGRRIKYDLDGLGRMLTVKNGNTPMATINTQYHPNGTVHQMQYANGQNFSHILNDRLMTERLLSYKGAESAIDQTLSYDARGLVTSIIDGAVSGNDRTYSYDGLGYLKTASGPWGAGSYSYDSLGNLRSKQLGTRTVSLNYDETRNRLSQSIDTGASGTRTVAYDGRGNVTTLGNLAFAYDMSDQPVAVTGTANGIGSANGTYRYDGNLKRVKSIMNDGTATKVIYNIYDASGSLVHIEKNNVGTDYVKGPMGTLARITDDKETYLHPNHLGSAQSGTKGNGYPTAEIGEVAWREQYTPFGETLHGPGANNDMDGFTGHIKDSATGLNYMQARYYDPVIGRFLSVDPVTFLDKPYPGQFNRYAYTWNDPINANDPDGEFLNFVAKFIVDVGLEVAIQVASGQEIDLGSATKGAALGLLDPTKTARKVAKLGKLANTARKANKTCCFVAGTLVGTEDGLRSIEDIEVGDLVWARDEETGEEALKPVLGLIRLHDRVIWDLETVSETGEAHTFGTTDDHPWWVEGHGWKRTDELSLKDILVTQTGEKVSILSVSNTNIIEPTFNFEVADFNTYFVGESKVWVHNAKKCRVGFSNNTKNEIRKRNQEAGGGVEHCVDCGVVVTRQKGPNQKGQKIASDRSEVDHDTRLADGGSNDAGNGRIRCHDCHKEKTIRENSK